MQEIRDRVEGITRMEEKFKFQLVVKEVSDYLNNKRPQLRFGSTNCITVHNIVYYSFCYKDNIRVEDYKWRYFQGL